MDLISIYSVNLYTGGQYGFGTVPSPDNLLALFLKQSHRFLTAVPAMIIEVDQSS
jgi:hypothetical protein